MLATFYNIIAKGLNVNVRWLALDLKTLKMISSMNVSIRKISEISSYFTVHYLIMLLKKEIQQ